MLHLKTASAFYFIHNCSLCVSNALRQLVRTQFHQRCTIEISPMFQVPVLTVGSHTDTALQDEVTIRL